MVVVTLTFENTQWRKVKQLQPILVAGSKTQMVSQMVSVRQNGEHLAETLRHRIVGD